MKNKTEFFTGTIIGAFITFVIILIWLSNTYGRMSNHLHCDLSKEKTEILK